MVADGAVPRFAKVRRSGTAFVAGTERAAKVIELDLEGRAAQSLDAHLRGTAGIVTVTRRQAHRSAYVDRPARRGRRRRPPEHRPLN